MSVHRRALVVGIDFYSSRPLKGCVADAAELSQRLRKNASGSPNFSVEELTARDAASAITRPKLRRVLREFFSNTQGLDLLFFYSGHGRQDAAGAELVTSELEGVALAEVMALANGCAANSVTIIVDCCFSGDLGNTPGIQSTQVAPDFRREIATLSTGVTVFAASKSREVSIELKGHGKFTRLLLDGLDGAATDHLGNITALSLYSHASRAFSAWDQTPVLKAHISDAVILRIGPQWVSETDVRSLPDHFPTAESRIALTIDHEGEGRPYRPGMGTEQQRELDLFKRLRNVGLATTDDDKDFYFTTLEGGDVYLTPAGRMMWGLAKRGVV